MGLAAGVLLRIGMLGSTEPPDVRIASAKAVSLLSEPSLHMSNVRTLQREMSGQK
jgi:hypothetical protein